MQPLPTPDSRCMFVFSLECSPHCPFPRPTFMVWLFVSARLPSAVMETPQSCCRLFRLITRVGWPLRKRETAEMHRPHRTITRPRGADLGFVQGGTGNLALREFDRREERGARARAHVHELLRLPKREVGVGRILIHCARTALANKPYSIFGTRAIFQRWRSLLQHINLRMQEEHLTIHKAV